MSSGAGVWLTAEKPHRIDMNTPDFEPAYLLHTRPYRESSLLAELLVAERGRVGAIMRGARGKPATQIFQPLLVRLAGQGELKTLKAAEPGGTLLMLAGTALFSGFYLNELLVRLLGRDLPLPALFMAYAQALGELSESSDVEPVLRRFEKYLLDSLGYGFDFDIDCRSGSPVEAGLFYTYLPEGGLGQSREGRDSHAGELLLELAAGHFETPAARQAAKRILRQALARQLGDRPLKSRELFLK
jgi:DNA repair protein RecO (recombination protein O)